MRLRKWGNIFVEATLQVPLVDKSVYLHARVWEFCYWRWNRLSFGSALFRGGVLRAVTRNAGGIGVGE